MTASMVCVPRRMVTESWAWLCDEPAGSACSGFTVHLPRLMTGSWREQLLAYALSKEIGWGCAYRTERSRQRSAPERLRSGEETTSSRGFLPGDHTAQHVAV